MGIKVTVDIGNLNKKFSAASVKKAKLAMANDAQQAMEKYVPYDGGGYLRDSGHVTQDGSVVYDIIYARAQFYGFITNQYGGPFRVHNYTTAGTSRRWDLRLRGNKQDMLSVKQAFIGGLNLGK